MRFFPSAGYRKLARFKDTASQMSYREAVQVALSTPRRPQRNPFCEVTEVKNDTVNSVA